MGPMIRSLSVRLLVPLLLIIVVGLAGHAVFNVRSTAKHWAELIHTSAWRTSTLIEDATHYGMLLNRKEDVHHTLRKIAESRGVAGIRIYDKQGKIIFSTRDTEIGRQVDMRADACEVCHSSGQPLRAVPSRSRMRVFRNESGQSILGLINPIENRPECGNADCHAHPKDQTVLGVLDVQLSMADSESAQQDLRRQIFWFTLVMVFVIGAGVVLFVHYAVRRPVRRLKEGTQRVALGELETRIPITSDDELGQLARAFNQMTDDLERAQQELTAWSQELEQKVVSKTEEVANMQRQALHMDKMASLGKLAAVVAHELNNPLSGILTYAKLVDRRLQREEPLEADVRAELSRYLSLVQSESSRCGDIVRNLLLFARRGGGQLGPIQVNELVERATMLIRHRLEMSNVQLETQLLSEDDRIVGDEGQLQQALLALLLNAVEACSGDDGGLVRLEIRGDSVGIEIEVSDTGAGIAPEILQHLFEPFYSTKEQNGVGLGLAVVYGIVRRHGGTVDVSSEVGVGSTFRMRIPRRPSGPPAAEAPELNIVGGGLL